VTKTIAYWWDIQQLLGQMDRSGMEDTCQFTAGIVLSNLKMVKKSALFYVSEPYLGGVCENREDDARVDLPPRKERKSTDGVT
jgi:hypothetical protein